MNHVFIDTGGLIALTVPKDQHAPQAKSIITEIEKRYALLVTTEYVVNEAATYNLTSCNGGYVYAMNLLDWLRQRQKEVRIEWVGKERFDKTVSIFQRFNKDKSWSFTDCTSYVVMKELKISTVFTFDEHFEQMGFTLLC